LGLNFLILKKILKRFIAKEVSLFMVLFLLKLEKRRRKKNSFSGLPLPDFGLLYKHKEYVRFALLAYLNLALAVRQKSFKGFQRSIEVLEAAIIDLKLRKKVISLTKKLFNLLPENQFKS